MKATMKVQRDDLPTEGIKIGKILFLPGKPTEVDAEMGKQLIARKGFNEVSASTTSSKSKED